MPTATPIKADPEGESGVPEAEAGKCGRVSVIRMENFTGGSMKSSQSGEGGLQNKSGEKLAADHIIKRLQERKYFDSGDYAIAKTSPKGSTSISVGRLHPSPERMPHSTSASSIGKSPMKEHVISSRDCLTELLDGEQEADNGLAGRADGGGNVNIGNPGKELAKGGGLAH